MSVHIDKHAKTIQEWRFIPMASYACPTYRVTRNESNSPEGLALLLNLIQNKRRTYNEVVAERLYQCSSCSLCTAHGFDDTDPALLFIIARADPVEAGLASKPILDYKEWLFATSAVDVAEFSNFNSKNRIGVFIDPIHLRLWPDIVKQNLKLLDRASVDYSVLGLEKGSGVQHFECGFLETAREIAKGNQEKFEELELETVVCFSPFDYRGFTEWYGELGIILPEKIKFLPLPLFLLDLMEKGKLVFKNDTSIKVTYHDSGNFARAKQSFLEIDKILRHIPQTELMQMWRTVC